MAPRVAGAPLTLDAIRQRLERAEAELSKQSVANPYVSNVRNLSKQDADKASSPLAREAWSAANKVSGVKIETVTQGRWVDGLLPAGVVTLDNLANLNKQALAIVASLTPAGATELPPNALDDLPRKIDAYFANTVAPSRLLPEQRDALAAYIRDACVE
jgi:hypothetical protein